MYAFILNSRSVNSFSTSISSEATDDPYNNRILSITELFVEVLMSAAFALCYVDKQSVRIWFNLMFKIKRAELNLFARKRDARVMNSITSNNIDDPAVFIAWVL